MKIDIIETEKNKFTKDEYKFLQLLEEDKVFEHIIIQSREVLKIPQEGFNIQNGHKLTDNNSASREIRLIKITTAIRGLYNLPRNWLLILTGIIYFGVARADGRNRFPIVELSKDNDSLIIKVNENISIRELKKYIDLNGVQIKDILTTLPGLPQIKLENIQVKKRILELKREGNKDTEIARKLEQEFGDKLSFSPEYYIISIERTRFEKSLEIILKKDVLRAEEKLNRKFPKNTKQ